MENLTVKIKHLLSGYVFRVNKSGLLPFKIDNDVFETSYLEFGAYQPTKKYHLIKTLSVKDQADYNDCVWNATTVQKEVDEQKILSVRSLVTLGYKNGYISGDGFAAIDAGQKVLQKYGILESGVLNEDTSVSFFDYTKMPVNLNEAAKHKINSYWHVNSKDDEIRLLEQDKPLVTGMDWYTGFNQGGGFSAPYLITGNVGWKIGGHSVLKKGYVYGFNGIDANNKLILGGSRNVYAFQNSYSDKWGATVVDDDGFEHKGLFFADMNFFDKYGYWCYANLDVGEDVINKVKLINMMKNAIRDSQGGFWFVKGNKKQKITGFLGLLTLISVELGIKTDDAKLAKLVETTEFFPVNK